MAPSTSAADAFNRLVEIVRYLRGPDGCPWDRAQTLQTLRAFVLEECYEVLDALDRDDRGALREELGDFVFEAVLLAQVCEEAGDFSIADSLEAISNKLVRRHVHVFGPKDGTAGGAPAEAALSPDQVVQLWERVKAGETSDTGKPKTTLGGVSRSLPALLRAHEIGTRAAAVGFDWVRASDVIAKIEEEVAELRAEVEAGLAADQARAEEEMGDLLFAIANLSRKLGIEPEAALREANNKFTRRFEAMEASLREHGRPLAAYSLDEMEAAWGRVKQAERTAALPPSAAGDDH
ncbi:MAG: nucleoside triphosphate pyrophosphohydrolase [Acidobacteriota bacterium]